MFKFKNDRRVISVTVQLVTQMRQYIGVSTDTKPTGVPVGSRFYKKYVGYGTN